MTFICTVPISSLLRSTPSSNSLYPIPIVGSILFPPILPHFTPFFPHSIPLLNKHPNTEFHLPRFLRLRCTNPSDTAPSTPPLPKPPCLHSTSATACRIPFPSRSKAACKPAAPSNRCVSSATTTPSHTPPQSYRRIGDLREQHHVIFDVSLLQQRLQSLQQLDISLTPQRA